MAAVSLSRHFTSVLRVILNRVLYLSTFYVLIVIHAFSMVSHVLSYFCKTFKTGQKKKKFLWCILNILDLPYTPLPKVSIGMSGKLFRLRYICNCPLIKLLHKYLFSSQSYSESPKLFPPREIFGFVLIKAFLPSLVGKAYKEKKNNKILNLRTKIRES